MTGGKKFADAFERVRSREMTGRDLLVECLDEALYQGDLWWMRPWNLRENAVLLPISTTLQLRLRKRMSIREFAVYLHEDTLGKLRQDRTRYQRKV